MPALSFSAIETLPALLNHEKDQTIRRLKPLFSTREGYTKDRYLPPRLKVSDIVTLYWKQRNRFKWFRVIDGWGYSCREKLKKGTYPKNQVFPKLLGKVEIIEVLEIEMRKHDNGTRDHFIVRYDGKEYGDESKFAEDLAKRDAFLKQMELPVKRPELYGGNTTAKIMGRTQGDPGKMFNYFDKEYKLLTPRWFAVYRWRWLNGNTHKND